MNLWCCSETHCVLNIASPPSQYRLISPGNVAIKFISLVPTVEGLQVVDGYMYCIDERTHGREAAVHVTMSL